LASYLFSRFTFGQELDNLAPDGRAVTSIQRVEPTAQAGKPSPFWGTFRGARLARPGVPWQVTLTARPPVSPGTPGAGPRATEQGAKPGLRLHWLAPTDATAILARAPRCRYHRELFHKAEASAAFAENLMHKLVVRREGKDLDSTFVAVWAPFPLQPWLDRAERLDAVPESAGVGVRLQAAAQSAIVFYRRPESRATLSAAGFEVAARYAILRTGAGEQALDVYDGVSAEAGPVSVQLQPTPAWPVAAVTEAKGVHTIVVAGDPAAYPADPAHQPHAGAFVRWRQEGQANRWLPLGRVEPGDAGKLRLVLTRSPGFAYSGATHTLDETHFPMRRGLHGIARVELPQWANVRWRVADGRLTGLRVRASSPVVLRVAGPTAAAFSVRGEHGRALTASAERREGAAVIRLDPAALGRGWWDIAPGTP